MTVDMIPVQSSNLSHVGYDADTQTLHVQFKNGGRRGTHANVPPELHQAMMSSDSLGGFYARHIRGRAAHPWEPWTGDVTEAPEPVAKDPDDTHPLSHIEGIDEA